MAAKFGEENVATLFGDIHYFYSPPHAKPCHHRFDKGSYVYLFENANERRCRVEVANQAGTDEQDAFDGFLDQTHVRYSYKQHCMVSLSVAGSVAESEWHLPTYDLRNENKYHYKLHSLDIYFWTQQDALQFVNGVRRVLPTSQVEVLDEPMPAVQQQTMRSVVQRLEDVAISDPKYGHANASVPGAPQVNTSSSSSAAGPSAALPPPPPPPPPPANFAPMAYNPAAPAAPEAIQHREKTPPPDEDPLNPLAVAVAYDYQKQPFTPGFPPQSQFPLGVASPGFPSYSLNSPRMPPSQQPGLHRAATMPVQSHTPLASPGLASPYNTHFGGPSHFAPTHLQQLAHPTPPLQSPGLPPAPSAGYSNYTYGQAPQVASTGLDYSVHQQLYRPTESDMATHKPTQYVPKQDGRGKLEENAGRLERGVSGMLKKFEKKFG